MAQQKGISGSGMHVVRSPFLSSWWDRNSLPQALLPGTLTSKLPLGRKHYLYAGWTALFSLVTQPALPPTGMLAAPLYSLNWSSVHFSQVFITEKHDYKLQRIPLVCSVPVPSLGSGSRCINKVGSEAWKVPRHTLKSSYPDLHASSCITGFEALCWLMIWRGQGGGHRPRTIFPITLKDVTVQAASMGARAVDAHPQLLSPLPAKDWGSLWNVTLLLGWGIWGHWVHNWKWGFSFTALHPEELFLGLTFFSSPRIRWLRARMIKQLEKSKCGLDPWYLPKWGIWTEVSYEKNKAANVWSSVGLWGELWVVWCVNHLCRDTLCKTWYFIRRFPE